MNDKKIKRVAFIMDEVLDKNIEIYCAATGSKKSDIARRIFINFLKEQGFTDPEHTIQISCTPLK